MNKLEEIVGRGNVLEGVEIGPRYTQDLWGGEPRGEPRLVLKPGSTEEVAEILRACSEAGRPIVPQGGMTGLVSAGVPDETETVVSLERMNRIEEVDPLAGTMTVQAGAVLQAVQERAAEHGLQFPLDLGSRGSCTIGGCIATNAGGNRVLLYGMTRDLVLGVEAVLADGTVVNGMRKLVKDNAGYDLDQLFVGTEGTLGVVTRALLRLRPRPTTQAAAFCALRSAEDAVALLRHLQGALPGMVSAFEAIWWSAYRVLLDLRDPVRAPFADEHPIYVLAECQGSHPETDTDRFTAALAEREDLVVDAVVATSPEDVQGLWSVRERVSEELLRLRPLFGFDISLPISELDRCLREIEDELRERWPHVRLAAFGHLGDGNVHIAVLTGETTKERKPIVEEIVYRNVGRRAGSISAEHGIGFEKRPYLHYSRSEQEIDVMRRLKRALDPANVLSPGRVFVLEP
jgi:FAD/FMN-containing dehydrogenase